MTLPIPIETIIDSHIIENERVEYKENWNPEKILHTICAYANDIENCGGGYIIIGVKEQKGIISEIPGIDVSTVSKMENELFNLCNMIEPRYVPSFSLEKYHEKDVVAIWAPSGDARPYKCPIRIGRNRHDSCEKGYFIRKMSNTIRADPEEEVHLISISRHTSFDEMVNNNTEVSAIMNYRIEDYLNRVKSRLNYRQYDRDYILSSMKLVKGPAESQRPTNIGLMLFSVDPEEYFEYAHIEIVEKPDLTGQNMTESIFRGPLDHQLSLALAYIKSNIIREKIFKVEGQAEALRYFNYPFEAIEEALVNAVYHKSYQIREPITVTLTPDSLEILSLPGPDESISDYEIKNLAMRSSYYRNKRLGDYLKELKLTEGRNTGLEKIKSSIKKNGSPMPEFKTDIKRSYLRVTFPVHPAFAPVSDDQPEPAVDPKRRSNDDIKRSILSLLKREGCLSTKEIYSRLGYSGNTSGFKKAINDLMDSGKICYLYPEKPRDSRQRICLVTTGTFSFP